LQRYNERHFVDVALTCVNNQTAPSAIACIAGCGCNASAVDLILDETEKARGQNGFTV
jgi:hypothetical protein